ncbi:MAG TPA: caspase family protein [Dongiaceae bacterium]
MVGRFGRRFAMVGVAFWLALSGLVISGLGFSSEALASARVALVVGNGDYGPEIGKLKNPANDAKLMSDTLKDLGFDVSLVTDADQKAMKRAIREFGEKLRATGPQGIGLFFYAGHGVQVDGENYLLPIGAEIQAEGDVELEAVTAASVLSQMQYAGNAVNLLFLDACRNNPLTRSFRSQTRGLARVDAPRGSFVGYSTAPGDVSVDGDAADSPYTLALVEELKTPGISIEEAHRAVRGKVLAATNQRQTPWDSSSLTAPVILKEAALAAPATPPTPAPQPQAQTDNPNQQAELLFWDSIKSSDNPATFEAYLKQFPNGIFAGLAQAKVAELKAKQDNQPATAEQQAKARSEADAAAWSGIKDSDNPALFEAYLKQFPDGTFAPLAQARLDELKKKQVAAAEPTDTQSAARTITPEPAPAPAPAPIEIQDLSGVYVATRSANVRSAPAADAKVLAKLAADQAIDATGQTADGQWLRVAVKGKAGFVSAKLMAVTDADEVADWSKLKGAPSEDGAKGFIAEHPNGYFQPKAQVLLAKLQSATKTQQNAQAAEAAAQPQSQAQPQPVVTAPAPAAAPTQTQQAAVTPDAPKKKIVRISSALREKVERYLKNSESFGNYYRFLAVNDDGSRIGMSNCTKMTTWMTDACGGATSPYDGAKRVALKECGLPNECRLIFEGAKKIGDFEIEWY